MFNWILEMSFFFFFFQCDSTFITIFLKICQCINKKNCIFQSINWIFFYVWQVMEVILEKIVTQCSILRESLITFWLLMGTNFINRKVRRKLSIGNVDWPNSWGEPWSSSKCYDFGAITDLLTVKIILFFLLFHWQVHS